MAEKSQKIINNPSHKILREMAKSDEITTAFGAPAYLTKKVASRSSKATQISSGTRLGKGQNSIDSSQVRKIEETVLPLLKNIELIQMDRVIGSNSKKTWHCRLLIPREYARIALLWSSTLFDSTPQQKDPGIKPDFLTLDLPQWPEAFPGAAHALASVGQRGIFVVPETGTTYILGTDYVGEVKMSFLRQAMYQMKVLGGLGLHAGSKALKIRLKDKIEEVGVLLFGLSGTGKTTLTLDDHALVPPEANELLQDDIVWLTTQGCAFGTEDNFYVKTEGVSDKDQPAIYHALYDANTVFENVAIGRDSRLPEFANYAHGTNGRALAIRAKIKGSSYRINLEKVHKMIFITRRDTVVPAVAKLSYEQAACFFMLGESIETSAGDPAKAGQPKHEVGFNPFIIGPEQEEGKRLLEIIRSNNIEVYFLNTGSIGKNGEFLGGAGRKITREISSRIILEISRGSISWQRDPDWGYEVAVSVPGINDWKEVYQPERYYSPETYKKITQDLRKERDEFLAQFQFKFPN